jgi:hypothetical protein
MRLLVTEMGFWRRSVKRTLQDKVRNEAIGEEVEAGKTINDQMKIVDMIWTCSSNRRSPFITRPTGMKSSRELETGQTSTDLIRTHNASEVCLRKM